MQLVQNNITCFCTSPDSTSPSPGLDGGEGGCTQGGAGKTCSTPVSSSSSSSSSQPARSSSQRPAGGTSSGHHTPTLVSPGGGGGSNANFPRPIYPVPLLSHVPLVRPPPQLHPSVVQRMLAQGISPQQLGPTLLQAGQLQLSLSSLAMALFQLRC